MKTGLRARFFACRSMALPRKIPGHRTTTAYELRLLKAAALGCFSGASGLFLHLFVQVREIFKPTP
jgi:hypothetical protein